MKDRVRDPAELCVASPLGETLSGWRQSPWRETAGKGHGETPMRTKTVKDKWVAPLC